MTPKFHRLRIADVRRETPDAVSLRFEVPPALAADYAFVQGQHLTLRSRLAGDDVRRSYSICAGVDDGELRVAIKRVPGGIFSTWAHDRLAPGDTIDVMTPHGGFHTPLDQGQRKRYAAFVAGSGITPVLSLARTTLAREPGSRFTLVYGNRRLQDTMFHESLEDLKDRYVERFALYKLFSRESQDVDLFNGRLDAGKVKAFTDTVVPAADIDEAFVCGPGAMIDEVEAALIEAGVAADHVHVERFGVPAGESKVHATPGDAASARVVIVLDGTRREIEYRESDGTVLDAALKAGLDLPFSCKGGMCCTCRAKILEGKVRMDKNYSLEAADVAAGFALMCQSHPLSERVVVSFDER